jgi:hypothetical protein
MQLGTLKYHFRYTEHLIRFVDGSDTVFFHARTPKILGCLIQITNISEKIHLIPNNAISYE